MSKLALVWNWKGEKAYEKEWIQKEIKSVYIGYSDYAIKIIHPILKFSAQITYIIKLTRVVNVVNDR